ncbi:MAG: hypothetical protein ACRDPE_06270 [Solirubrobacterales bacterium]
MPIDEVGVPLPILRDAVPHLRHGPKLSQCEVERRISVEDEIVAGAEQPEMGRGEPQEADVPPLVEDRVQLACLARGQVVDEV